MQPLFYFLLCVSVLLIGIQYCVLKIFQLKMGNSVRSALAFSSLAGLFSGLVCICMRGASLSFSWFSFLLAIPLAVAITTNNLLSVKVVSLGKLSVFTMFLMLGGMICPFLYGAIVLKEPAGVWRYVALAVLIGAMVLSALGEGGKRAKSPLFYILCVLVFLSNGVVSVVSKAHQGSGMGVDTESYLVLVYALLFFLNGAAFGILLLRKKNEAPMSETEPQENAATLRKAQAKHYALGVGIIAIYGIVSAVAFFLQVRSAIELPATVMYPIVTGGTIAVTPIFGRIFFKEKISKCILAAILVALAATCLFLIP